MEPACFFVGLRRSRQSAPCINESIGVSFVVYVWNFLSLPQLNEERVLAFFLRQLESTLVFLLRARFFLMNELGEHAVLLITDTLLLLNLRYVFLDHLLFPRLPLSTTRIKAV